MSSRRSRSPSVSSSSESGQDEEATKTQQATSNSSSSIVNTAIYLFIYLLGVGTFFFLVSDFMCMKTYFSDNSLLPGLVQREFALYHEALAYLDDLESIAKIQQGNEYSKSPLVNRYLREKLQTFGLISHTQHFQYKQRFLSKYNEEPPILKGTNLYSIIRAERAQTSQAVVLSAPYSHDGRHSNLAGISLILALTKYFVTRNYWSKDVIILFTDHNNYGTWAWLDAYHNVNYQTNYTNNIGIEYGALDYTSGPILAAINLELHTKNIEHINIKIEGLNGQLPNLDLFNLVVEMAARESITPKFHGHSLPFSLSAEELYYRHLSTVFSMMKTQATMSMNGAHGLFQKYSIQSLTLEAIEHKQGSNSNIMLASLLNVGRLVEGIFRSLNNLIERFNRSYYFYLLPGLRRFISIGYYMIAFGIMVSPLVLKSLKIYQNGLRFNESLDGDKASQGKHEKMFNLWEGAASCAKAQLFGSMLLVLPSLILDFDDYFHLNHKVTLGEVISFGFIISSLVLPLLYKNKHQNPDIPSPRLLAALLNLALVLGILSLINISLTLFLSFAMVPIAILVSTRKTIVSRNINRIILLFIHPIILSVLGVTVFNQVRHPERHIFATIKHSSFIVSRSISSFAEEWYLYGNWAYMVGPLLYPVWIQLWSMP